MNLGKLFSYTIITLDIGAAIGYLIAKDYRRAIYWAAAAVLTSTVTF
jgi:hypothetical protein